MKQGDEQATRCREGLVRCRQAVADLTALSGKVFEHEERYRELLKRQGEYFVYTSRP